MALSIRNPKAEQLARQVAGAKGVNITEAIIQALEEEIKKLEKAPIEDSALIKIMNISHRCAALPILDARPEEQILGYAEDDT